MLRHLYWQLLQGYSCAEATVELAKLIVESSNSSKLYCLARVLEAVLGERLQPTVCTVCTVDTAQLLWCCSTCTTCSSGNGQGLERDLEELLAAAERQSLELVVISK